MTNQEFSNSFTTLLNSYNTQAQFGEEASRADISLDEYEKSVLLTQAQDIVVKSYFNRNFNQQGEGFDDSSRRQVDFSSLIKVALLSPTNSNLLYDSRGVVFKMPRKIAHDGHVISGTTDVLFILNEKLIVEKTLSAGIKGKWILKNYGDGTTIFTSNPNVEYHDLSSYYLIEGDDVPRYDYPGTPIFHAGNKEYWTINGDRRKMKYYGAKPTYTTFNGKPESWTVKYKNITLGFSSLPEIIPHAGWSEYWTIDIDENDPPRQYEINPGEPIHYGAPYWWVNDITDVKYYEEIKKDDIYIDGEDDYWMVEGFDTQFPDEPDEGSISRVQIGGGVWVINDDESNPINENPGDKQQLPSDWIIYYDDDVDENEDDLNNLIEEKIIHHFEDKEPTIQHIVNECWHVEYVINPENIIPMGTFNHNPVNGGDDDNSGLISTINGVVGYVVDSRPENRENRYFKEYYILQAPTIYHVGPEDHNNNIITVGDTRPQVQPDGWYITGSNYGDDIGPFQYEPSLQQINSELRYWLIDDDTKNPYFKAIVGVLDWKTEQWQVFVGNNRYDVYNKEVKKYKIPTRWYFSNLPDNLYFEEPHKEYIDPTYEWQFTISGVSYSLPCADIDEEEPVFEHIQLGSTIWKIQWVNDGTYNGVEHHADDYIEGLQFTTEPTIHDYVPSGEEVYWAYDNADLPDLSLIHFENKPTAIHHNGQAPYWTINEDPFMYDEEIKSEYHEAVKTTFIIDSDKAKFDFQPVFVLHESNDSYWSFNGINGKFNINKENQPGIFHITDDSPDSVFYTINNSSTRYYENGRPEFDVTDEVSPEKIVNEYVIVPISYREYDREMSKPYAQPLKKQAWRLFQNNSTGFDFDSELIPKFDVKQHILDPEQPGFNIGDIQLLYKIRYIRRPRPIILEDLPNGLEIDGETEESSCELNPIIHIDILNKAVELALATRAKAQPQQGEQRERER